MNYMDTFLARLRDVHGITDAATIEAIKAEVLQSFKNGIAAGRKKTDRKNDRTPARTR